MSCATTLAGIPLSSCVYNASGPRTGSIEALIKIGESRSGAVLSKSATLVKQDGNPLPRFVNKISLGDGYCQGSINSEGLPNLDVEKENVDKVAAVGKPYIVSISGHSLEDNLRMLDLIYSSVAAYPGINAIELNFACPNVPGKPMVAYDFEQLESALEKICAHPKHGAIPLGVKLAPYFDMPHFERVASIIVRFPVQYIVSINTIGNGLVIDFDNECEGMAARKGLGGLGGGFVKHTALANVRQLYTLLTEKGRSDIDIVGVGGVHNGRDVFELILCGAKAVQVGTCHWTEGSVCFDRIEKELLAIMKEKGYSSIEDFRGKLKPFVKPSGRKGKELVSGKLKVGVIDDGRPGPTTLQNIMMSVIVVMAAAILYLVQELQKLKN
eukprot:scaffold6042_cov247-Ochromonas_danica.AAC.2